MGQTGKGSRDAILPFSLIRAKLLTSVPGQGWIQDTPEEQCQQMGCCTTCEKPRQATRQGRISPLYRLALYNPVHLYMYNFRHLQHSLGIGLYDTQTWPG